MFVVSSFWVNIKGFDKPNQESRCYVHFDSVVYHEFTYMVNDLKLLNKTQLLALISSQSPSK